MTICRQQYEKTTGETRACAVDMGSGGVFGKLDSGELLTTTSLAVTQYSATPATTTAVTIANIALTTGALTINGRSAAAAEAVKFTVAGGANDTEYVLKTVAVTNASPAQTLEAYCKVRVRNP